MSDAAILVTFSQGSRNQTVAARVIHYDGVRQGNRYLPPRDEVVVRAPSHDRWFLDRIATHILAFEGDSKVVWFEGNYQDYEADRRRRLGALADQPHRIKYKPLVRY